jgi:hypothetical protein
VTASTLRWALAAVLTAGLVAGSWLLLADRPLPLRGGSRDAAAKLAGVRVDEVRRGRALTVTETRRARGEVEGGGAGRGLGARLVDSGRPRSPLSGVDVKAQLPPAGEPGPERELPGRQVPPAPGKAERAKQRARANDAGRLALPADFVPRRRKIPVRPAAGAGAAGVLAPPAKVPRLRVERPALTPPAGVGPAAARGAAVAPPAAEKRLPAPVLPLELGD